MIKFFRHIRRKLLEEGKLGKYLKYAIGEIVLVVIGILIALQINNWNIKKTEQTKIKEYAQSLIQDLEEDISMSNMRLLQTIRIANRIDSLSHLSKNNKIEDISNLDFVCLSWNLLYMPYSWNRVTLEQLKSSGSLQYIKDVTLIKKIGEYDAFTQHLDEDYLNDKAKTEDAIELLNKVTNNNYSNIDGFRNNVLFKTNDLKYEEFSYFLEPEYLKAKSYNLKLITQDINDVNRAINSLIRYQFHLNIRSKSELPRLIKDAEKLITLLKIYSDRIN